MVRTICGADSTVHALLTRSKLTGFSINLPKAKIPNSARAEAEAVRNREEKECRKMVEKFGAHGENGMFPAIAESGRWRWRWVYGCMLYNHFRRLTHAPLLSFAHKALS